MQIEELNFSVRTYNCLKRKGIDTVDQLKDQSDEDLLGIRCFGKGCLKEVRAKIQGKPVIPGPGEENPHIMELCFRNGEDHMREKVIALLMEHKTCPTGFCHEHIVYLIQEVERL